MDLIAAENSDSSFYMNDLLIKVKKPFHQIQIRGKLWVGTIQLMFK